jgi:hypothetical protein
MLRSDDFLRENTKSRESKLVLQIGRQRRRDEKGRYNNAMHEMKIISESLKRNRRDRD